MSHARSQAGFTLVEMAVVFALIAFLAAISVPGMSAYFRRQDARTQAQYMADTLGEARQLAIKEGNPYLILFDATTAEFQVVDDDDGDFQVDAGEIVRDLGLMRGLKPQVTVWRTGAPAADPVPEDDDPSLPSPAVTFPDDAVRSAPGVAFNTQGFPVQLPAVVGGAPGAPGSGQGSYYVTDNDQVVYAATLLPLGATRLRVWRPGLTDWH